MGQLIIIVIEEPTKNRETSLEVTSAKTNTKAIVRCFHQLGAINGSREQQYPIVANECLAQFLNAATPNVARVCNAPSIGNRPFKKMWVV